MSAIYEMNAYSRVAAAAAYDGQQWTDYLIALENCGIGTGNFCSNNDDDDDDDDDGGEDDEDDEDDDGEQLDTGETFIRTAGVTPQLTTVLLCTNFGNRDELRIDYDVESSFGRGGLHFGSPDTLPVRRQLFGRARLIEKFAIGCETLQGAKSFPGFENLPRSFWHELSSPFTEVYEVESFVTETSGTPEPRPFFEDPESNITVQLGAQVYMHCRVQNLQDTLKVSWVRRRGEELHLLTIGLDTYASDSRFSLAFEKPNDWRLLLRSATERDAGLYECQVSAHPPLIRTVHLAVSVPKVEIVDEHGATAGDKFYKAGSTIELKCVVSNIPQPTGYVTWRHGTRTLNYDTTRGGIRHSVHATTPWHPIRTPPLRKGYTPLWAAQISIERALEDSRDYRRLSSPTAALFRVLLYFVLERPAPGRARGQAFNSSVHPIAKIVESEMQS
ncbi:Limbic system-associated membrane protein [Harpegnathos saltator]|uniref:Limbic system-associated membrane protein n=1 Tax=Harpegnathos saltator TaxID=610380 RepID=E2B400_HARSA|nr:Limbic system-associated membrane protein [Harpegnathos saltator]